MTVFLFVVESYSFEVVLSKEENFSNLQETVEQKVQRIECTIFDVIINILYINKFLYSW